MGFLAHTTAFQISIWSNTDLVLLKQCEEYEEADKTNFIFELSRLICFQNTGACALHTRFFFFFFGETVFGVEETFSATYINILAHPHTPN